jgi:DNA-directed RNA polymerase specialized sigma24 family protein
MSDDEVTQWLPSLREGDKEAVERIVSRYLEPVVRLVHRRLDPKARRGGDEEDVALSTLHSFVWRAQDGQFDQLQNRDDVWRLLFAIATRKAASHVVRETAQKRGGGELRGESVFATGGGFDRFVGNELADEADLETRESADQVLVFLDTLGDQAMVDVALYKSVGLSNAEIAKHLDCATKTVERKLKRLREKAQQWAEEVT